MVNLFSKNRKKTDQDTNDPQLAPSFESPPRTSSFHRKQSSSPEKTSRSDQNKVRDRDKTRDREKAKDKARGSRRPLSSRYASKRGSQHERDADPHPLNLSPEERSKRLSELSAMSAAGDPMDIDREAAAFPTAAAASISLPMSPPPTTQAQPATSGQSQPNGTNGSAGINGAQTERAPTPPMHKPQTGPSQEDAEAHKAAGNKFFKAREFDKAAAEYSKAIDIDTQSSTYRSNRAAAYMSAGRFAAALEDAKAADELEPNNAKILLRLARIYTSLGRPQEALDVYAQIEPPTTAKDMQPATLMRQHITQAESALRDGSGSMALHALDQAERGLGSGVERPRKWRLLRGAAHLKMGNVNALGEAQSVAMALLRENQQDPEALVLRGRVLYAQGENEKAIQHFRSALGCDPDFSEALRYLRMVQKLTRMKEEGNEHFKAGRMQKAVEVYTEALEVDRDNRGINSKLLLNRAIAYKRLKQYTKAIEDCEKALKLDPSYTKARRTKATALGEAGDWEEAVRELKAIGQSNPEEPGLAKDIRNAELELKKSKRKDYYKILAVDKDAGDGEIKRAYRKLAIVHHPDKNPGDEAAAERFKDIGEAYETLSDPQKRARYDSGEDLIDPSEMFGGGMGGMGGMGGGVQIDPAMLFNMMNGGGGGGGFSFASGGGGHPFGGMHGGRGGFPF